MFLIRQLCISTLFFVYFTPAYSADVYYGFRFGMTQFDSDISATTGTSRLEENDFGYKFYMGSPFSESTAIELFYTDYGEVTLGGHAGDTFIKNATSFSFLNNDSELSSGLSSLGINGVYKYSLGKTQSLIGKLGLVGWKYNFKIQSPADNISNSENNYDVYWNIGFQQNLGKNLSLLFDYEMLETDDLDLSALGFAIQINF